MEPQIQYAKTSDGANIAFATYGEGRPLVWSHQPLTSHVQREWQIPILRATFAPFATQGMLVRFDTRGVGLSDRDVDDFSLEARVRDLEAVVEHLQLKEFSLLGVERGGLPAISYAANHPERVSHLVLVNCFVSGEINWGTQRAQALELTRLMDDWEMYTENIAAQAFGFGSEESKGYAEFVRECISPEVLARIHEAENQIDLSSLLSEIQPPTLVVRHSGFKWLPMDVTRQLAAGIPNARLYEVEGFYQDNSAEFLTAIFEFLNEGEEAAAAPGLAADDVHTILFTDIEGSAALRQRLGDAKAQDLVRTHNSIVRDALKAHDGSEVKHTGDGIMASFSSAAKALEGAIAMQRGVAEHVEEHPDLPLAVYIGLNAGEPIAEDQDLFGTSVDLAKRICDHAKPGQIVASNVVRELAAGKRFLFADLGDTEMRGFEDPVRLYEVRWSEDD